jgi:hypothetical protein
MNVNLFGQSAYKLDTKTLRLDNRAAGNNTYPKVAVQWLNLPAGRRVKLCASIKVSAWLTVKCSEIATFG